MPRKDFPPSVETSVLMKCKRRCALCFGLNGDSGAKERGQLAHIDRDPENNAEDNAAWLCHDHHDRYDMTSHQTKGYTPGELRGHQETLLAYVLTIRKRTKREPSVRRASKGRGMGVALDVYDRRLPTYLAARQFVRDVSEKLSPELKRILKFASDTDEALFLYDESVAEYLETLFKKALRLHTLELVRERMARDPDEAKSFQELLQEETALAHWFAGQPEEIRARFTPFLRLA